VTSARARDTSATPVDEQSSQPTHRSICGHLCSEMCQLAMSGSGRRHLDQPTGVSRCSSPIDLSAASASQYTTTGGSPRATAPRRRKRFAMSDWMRSVNVEPHVPTRWSLVVGARERAGRGQRPPSRARRRRAPQTARAATRCCARRRAARTRYQARTRALRTSRGGRLRATPRSAGHARVLGSRAQRAQPSRGRAGTTCGGGSARRW